MATLRSDMIIDRPVEDVWSVVSDAGRISAWFPSVLTSAVIGDERHCELEGGVPLHEVVVTDDGELHRFQYRIVGVYGTEIGAAKLAGALGPAIADGVRGLKEYCESRP